MGSNKEKNQMVDVNDRAPDFSQPTGTGEMVSLSGLKGKTVVLYFYPKDNTPGCTQQAIGFTALAPEFERAGAVVLGVSKDTVKKHQNFSAKHNLSVTLVSDVEGEVCEAYGTWVEKSLYGRKYMGIERATFLIDGTGVVRRVWRKVKVKNHAQEVLDAVKAL